MATSQRFSAFVDNAPVVTPGVDGKIPIVQSGATHFVLLTEINNGVSVLTPVSGSTVTLGDLRPVYINTIALAALTIRLPPAPSFGAFIEICFAAPVTALSVCDGTGVVIPTAPTSAYGPGAALQFRYVGAPGWVYWK